LEQRTHGRDDDVEGHRVGMHQAAQDRQAAADGVRARRQPLVRQCLPRRVEGHRVGPDEVAQHDDQIFGLTLGGGDDEHCPGLGQRGGDERTKGLWTSQRELVDTVPLDEPGHARVGPDGFGECGQRGVDPCSGGAHRLALIG
jgi:hypothetical protein